MQSLGVVPATIGILDGKVHVGAYVVTGTQLSQKGKHVWSEWGIDFWV